MKNHITLKELADELGLDRSNLRKYVNKLGLEFHRLRTPESRGQLTLSVTNDEAEYIRKCRSEAGFIKNKNAKNKAGIDGCFYAVLPDKEARPNRVKFGFTTDLKNRLSSHRTCCPKAELIIQWPCKRTWESAILDSLSAHGGVSLVAGEVYDCYNIDLILKHLGMTFMAISGQQEH